MNNLLIVVSFMILFVLILGIMEQVLHNRRLKKLEIRINVNGTRGKSTVTRLITGILKEAGYDVVGKTTGTSARIIYWNQTAEKPIVRGPLGPNIIEQKKVIKEVVKIGAKALVTECMAVNPDYQIVFQEKLVKANIGVIVNVREDHLDLCGPTLDHIAHSFTSTIPNNGHLIISDSKYNDYFIKKAEIKNTKTIIADSKKVPKDYLSQFRYIIFPENVSIALGVAEALNIDEETALRGMLNSNPDPGALEIIPIGEENPAYFVNAFAANDPNSTLMIWNHVTSIGYPDKEPLVILNCRPDRVDRTLQYAQDVLPNIDMDALIVMGESTKPVTEAFGKGTIRAKDYFDFEKVQVEKIFESMTKYFSNRLIFGIGNIHGGGEELVELIEKYAANSVKI